MLDVLNEGEDQFEYVESAFKSTRVANAQSLEIPKPKILQFMIQHRFGSIENGFYDLFGTDYAVIRYDFSYGLNEQIALGVGRSSFDKIYDIFLKAKLIHVIEISVAKIPDINMLYQIHSTGLFNTNVK